MKTSTSEGKHGIQLTAQNQLDDLEFSGDLALLFNTYEQMQIKTTSVAAVSASVGLSIHKGKTKVLKFKTENSNPITLGGETLEDLESFTYLGSIIDEQGGSDADLSLLSQSQQQMKEKTSVAAASAAVGLNIHKGKKQDSQIQHSMHQSNQI
ncbi:unnamed protein product [Schistosoma margrebowiei]|uniref:Uncharacterized protein n=1 Tax=Schistosoma margrebowiei TaxID=48269 RepID=A0A183LZA2_9TREM|nr:unnamed protein product [Schistosoma margrebowiei]